MEDWIHLFVIIIFHLIVYELQSEFFGDVLNSLLCCTWCLLVLWVILTVCESSLEDWDIQLREQWRGPQFFVATWGDERIHMSAFFRKWLSWWGGKLLRLAVIFFFLILFCARACTEQIPHSEWACRVARGQCGTGNMKSIVTAPKKEALHIEKIESSWGRCVTMNLQWTVTCVSKIVNCHCKYTHIQCICASVCPSYSFLLWVRVVLFLSSKKS